MATRLGRDEVAVSSIVLLPRFLVDESASDAMETALL